MTSAAVLAAESNMAALGVGVLLLGGWVVGCILLFRSGAKRKRAQASAEVVPQPDQEASPSTPQSSQED
jgi:hypothetical protein